MLAVEDIRFFEVIAGSPTLAAAARTLDVTPPSVTQRLQKIEAKLKVRLVDRSTRHLLLTDEGLLLAQQGRSIIESLEQLSDMLAERRSTVAGHLRVAAPFGFGRRFISPTIAQFRATHTETTIELILCDSPTRLATEAWDLLVHIGELRDSTLVGRRLAPNTRIACASPEYLRRRGTPRMPDELVGHDCSALRENDEDATLWRFARSDGTAAAVRINPTMISNDGDVLHDWALSGLGIMVRSEWNVATDLATGRLVQILPEWQLPTADVVALLHRNRHRAERTTRFLDLLRRSLAPPPWRV
jgi:DNA-binding transcriptional LysR family regulator